MPDDRPDPDPGARPAAAAPAVAAPAVAASAVAAPDCGECGACCHRGFDVLEVEADDPFAGRLPRLLERAPDGEGWQLPRPDGWCPLVVRALADRAWRCAEYDGRPRGCVRFTPGSEDCLVARDRAARLLACDLPGGA